MLRILGLIALLLIPFISAKIDAQQTTVDDPKEIIKKAEEKSKGETLIGEFEMKIHRPEYERTLVMNTWNKGNDKALIEITAPAKDAGNKTLKIGNELWTYLENTETTMKLPPSMMLQSWNGSDLTNDDLVRESSLSEDYNISLLLEEKIAGEMCWKFELKPKEDAPVVWGSIYYWVRKVDLNPALVQYYDEDGEKIRSMKFEKIREMGGRTIPTVWKVIDSKEKDNYTEFIFKEAKFNVKIPDRIFSFRELEK